MVNYIAQADLQTYLDVILTTNGQAQFNAMLPNMQSMIDIYCNRTWNFTNPITEYVDAYEDSALTKLKGTFFPKNKVSLTPFSSSFPQAGGVNSIMVGAVNGVGAIPIDLTYVYAYGTYIKFWAWNFMTNLFNPLGYRSVQIIYNSDDASPDGTSNANVPGPIKQALIEWMARKIKTSPAGGKETLQAQADTVKVQYVEDKTPGIPDFVKLACDQYRIPPVDHS